MVKQQAKPQGNSNIPQINSNLTPKLDSKLSKSRKQINQENYQKNKTKRNIQTKARYQQQKAQTQQAETEQLSKYYEVESIKILMSLKDYTNLNQAKHKLWLDFIWTFKDLNQTGFHDIVQIMRIQELAENLIKDYWTTAKNEIRKGKNWNSLNQEQQNRLINYWAYEKARQENNYLTTTEKLAQQSQSLFKSDWHEMIQLAKFHEERGKIKCPCYQCQETKQRLKAEIESFSNDYSNNDKEQCSSCNRWVKELDELNDLCKKCMESYE